MKKIILALFCLLFVVACTSSPSGYSTIEGTVIQDDGTAIVDGVKTNIDITTVYCADTDGGRNEDVRGIISGVKSNGEIYRQMDECFGGILLEYFCDGVEVKSENVRCNTPCYFGECS